MVTANQLYASVFLRNRILFALTAIGVAVNIGMWVLIASYWDTLRSSPGGTLALHYKVFFGIDYLAYWYYIFLLPAVGLSFIALNYILARGCYHYHKVLVYSLMGGAALAQLVLCWAIYLILQVNVF